MTIITILLHDVNMHSSSLHIYWYLHVLVAYLLMAVFV